jgi:hypothetical protein
LGLRERAMGLTRIQVSKAMDVAAATRSGASAARARDSAVSEPRESQAFSPVWLVSSVMERDEATALSRKVLGHAIGRETIPGGRSLPFAARCALATRPDLGLMCCFDPAPQWSWPSAAEGEARQHVLIRPAS